MLSLFFYPNFDWIFMADPVSAFFVLICLKVQFCFCQLFFFLIRLLFWACFSFFILFNLLFSVGNELLFIYVKFVGSTQTACRPLAALYVLSLHDYGLCRTACSVCP